MVDTATGERAYVGLGRADHQNAFVLAVPQDVPGGTAAWFKQLYAMPLGELLDSLAIPYALRETPAPEVDDAR
jgi:hypothetical protein